MRYILKIYTPTNSVTRWGLSTEIYKPTGHFSSKSQYSTPDPYKLRAISKYKMHLLQHFKKIHIIFNSHGLKLHSPKSILRLEEDY